jgi:hypothetical protein
MRQLPERLFLVFLLLLSLPVINPVSGAFASASFEWQEEKKNSSGIILLIPEIEGECEEEKEDKEESETSCFFRPLLYFSFSEARFRFFISACSCAKIIFFAASSKETLRFNCIWKI